MSLLVPCDSCGSREKGKNAWCAWAWNRADNTRVAWKQRLCMTCFLANCVNLITHAEAGEFTCPGCGIDPTDTLDPVYLTYVVPGYDKRQAECALCAACAVDVRSRALVGSQPLADREVRVGAESAAPTLSLTSGWDALGLGRGPRD